MSKAARAFSVTADPPKGTAHLWANVYKAIMARATDTLRRRTGAAFSVIDPTPAFSVWPRKDANSEKEK